MDSAQIFAEDVKYNCLSEYVHLNAKWHRPRGFFFFWKHEISTVPGRLKIEKSMIFFDFLVLCSYYFLSVKSCVERVFAGFRAIRCHFVVCNSFTYDRIEFNFFAKDVKYNYFTEYIHSNVKWHSFRGFFLHEISTVPGCLKIEKFMIFSALLVLSSYWFLK